MVKSNFPGKPRSGHRKLISASTCPGTPNEASLVAENIYHGLSAFNAAFGLENEQLPTFHGFSPHQVLEAKKAAETSYKHVETECEARGVIFVPFLPSKKFLKCYKTPECGAETPCTISLYEDKENADKLNCDADCCDRVSNSLVSSNCAAICKSSKKVLRENAESSDIFEDKLSNDSDSSLPKSKLNSLNSRKFVLPCRSSHSSRVIKPNKRFLDVDVEDGETACVSSETADIPPVQSSNFVPLKKPKLIFDENKSRDACWKIDPVENTSSSFSSTPSTSKPIFSKGILREAILNIELSPIKSDGFKSSNKAKANTIVCGVCGAVRFYKFKKQTRKFGVISCESCRKFISKMVNLLPTRNAASYSGGVLECHNQKGRIGCCDNPSILRNKEWNFKNVKLSNNQRCPACWLNTCIRKYNIPLDKRVGLSRMIPQEMRIHEFPEESTVSTCGRSNFKQPRGVKISERRKTQDKNCNIQKKKHKNAIHSISNMARFIASVKNGDQTSDARQKKMEINNKIRLAKNLRKRTASSLRSKRTDLAVQKLKKNTKDLSKKSKLKKLKKLIKQSKEKRFDSREVTESSVEEKRDKYFMKGPRVKHVCRSASIVLGQPMATFSISRTTVSSGNFSRTKSRDSLPVVGISCSETLDAREEENSPLSPIETFKPDDSSGFNHTDGASTVTVKEELQKSVDPSEARTEDFPLARTLQDLEKQQEEETDNQAISIDFWENYDPEEVCKTGFALIGSEPIHVDALCFLCGSSGVDKLVHCVSCCEAYHQYCVEMNMHPSKLSLDQNWWRVDWVCPKCTFCSVCNEPAPQLSCQRCEKSYHSNCISPNRQRPQLTDRTWVCPPCLRCKSCNQTNVSKFIGNLPLCAPCFKLRLKGNFCPLCQRCYEDDDYDSKMMECGKCKCWVHAKCEGLSNEKYQVLSYLPESVEYICRVCCDIPPASWWLAVEEELKTGYLNVLKCLSKNKKACDILKWSPKKRTADCICRNGVRVRTLRFSDSNTNGTKLIRDGDNKCLNRDVCDSKQNESVNLSDSDINESCLNLNKTTSSTLNASNLLRVNIENSDCQGNFFGSHPEKTAQFSPHGTQSDSGIGSTDDELKGTSSVDGESNFDERSFANGQCFCSGLETWTKAAPTLLSIKKKVNGNEYSSLLQFHDDVETVINSIIESEDLTRVYHQTLSEVFPWFDPQGSKVFDTRSSCDLSMDDSLELDTSDIMDGHKSILDENVKCLLSYQKEYYYLGRETKDERICALCKGVSEGPMFEEGRLLYCGHNDWIHSNCALWSGEVFEEIDGSLQNVHSAISRGKMIRCSKCLKKGATIGCCTRNCTETYHFPCAREANCTFFENKTIRCHIHSGGSEEGKILTSQEEFHISRPVYVELERKKKKLIDYRNVKLAVGSLHVHNLGKFEPKVSDTALAIIPVEFSCSRLFWSAMEPWKLIPYHIKTNLVDSSNEYDSDLDLNYTVDHSVVVESPEEINLAVCEVVSFLCDTVCLKEEERDGQSNVNDLLSEQDTIFEDLPNEFFDGVFKDISSKMISIEDLVAAGDKDDSNQSDSDGNNMMEMSEDDSQNCTSDTSLKPSFEFSVSSRFPQIHSKSLIEPGQSTFLSKSALCKDLPMGKNDDAVLHVKIQGDYNSTDDNARTYFLKDTNLNSLRLLQVDGLVDCSSCSDTSSNSDDAETLWVESECDILQPKSTDEIIYNDKWTGCQIPQLDGSNETSDKEESEENPVRCSRCRRTYRTDISYQRHVSSCNAEYMSSSGESDYEEDSKSTSIDNLSADTVGSDDPLHVSEIKLVDDITVTTHELNSFNIVPDQNTVGHESHENKLSNNGSVAPNQLQSIDTRQESAPEEPNLINKYCASIAASKASFISSSSSCSTAAYNNSVNGKGRPLKVLSTIKKSEPLTQCMQLRNPIIYQQTTQAVDQPQYNRTSVTAPTFILQQMPSAGINISSFVQPVSQTPNVQYITAVEPSTQPQYIATPDLMNPGTYRIQQSSVMSPIVPQVVSAIIQPPVEQIVTVNPQTSNIDFFAAQNQGNNIFLSSQPVMGAVVNNSVLCNSVVNNSLLNSTLINNSMLNSAVLNNALISNPVVGNSYQTMTTQLIQTSKPSVETTSYVIVNTEPSMKDCLSVASPAQSIQTTPWTPASNWSINKHMCKTTKEVTTMYHANAQLIPDQREPSQVNCVKVVKKKTTEEMMIETASVNSSFYGKAQATMQANKNVPVEGVSAMSKFVSDIPPIFNTCSLNVQSQLSSSSNSPLIKSRAELPLVKDIRNVNETQVPSSPVSEALFTASSIHLHSAPQTGLNSPLSNLKPQVEICDSTNENVKSFDPQSSPPYSVSEVFSNEIKNFRTYSSKKPTFKPRINNILHADNVTPGKTTSPVSSGHCVNSNISFVSNTTTPFPLSSINTMLNSVLDSKVQAPCKSFHSQNLADSRVLKPANKIDNLEPRVKNGLTKHVKILPKPKPSLKNGKKCNKPKVVFEINSEDGFSYSTTSLADAWQKIFEAVQQARAARKLPLLPQNPFKNAEASLRTLGLDNNGLKYLLEQLPGVGRCAKYKPTYHKPKPNLLRQDSLKENKTGCARSEPFSTRTEKYDMFSWLASRHRRPPKLIVATEADLINGNRRTASINLPMAMRFRHLKETSREAVGVFRSDIHGRGLFCLRDIDAGEMVIEYAGEVIRAALTDKRENFYNSKGIGCYMFRIDDYYVVDATLKGNAARFINHSCEPNCYSRIVDILGKKHILIFAQRRIPQGEELTYDYKFPLEEDKISCHCLSRKCRKYLN